MRSIRTFAAKLNQLNLKAMNYTRKYTQVSDAAAKAKFRRMAAGVGRTGTNYFEAWFSNWWIGGDFEAVGYENEDEVPPSEKLPLSIFVNTNYHGEGSLNRMYKTNCKTF